MTPTPDAWKMVRTGSTKQFTCTVFESAWDGFVVEWMPTLYTLVAEALGPFGREPLPNVQKLSDGMHMSGATASFDMGTGQVSICSSVEGNAGQTLEKLTHELIHGSLALFPSVDEFYDEGEVDYATWVLAHAPVYGQFRQQTIDAAAFNIAMRRERAFTTGNDYDKKRWAGGLFAMLAYGPMTLARLKNKKMKGDFSW